MTCFTKSLSLSKLPPWGRHSFVVLCVLLLLWPCAGRARSSSRRRKVGEVICPSVQEKQVFKERKYAWSFVVVVVGQIYPERAEQNKTFLHLKCPCRPREDCLLVSLTVDRYLLLGKNACRALDVYSHFPCSGCQFTSPWNSWPSGPLHIRPFETIKNEPFHNR